MRPIAREDTVEAAMRLLPLFAFVGAMTGCIVWVVAPAPVGGVTFVVYINPVLFATDGVLSVDVWNAAQLAILDDNARCASFRGPTAAPLLCPPDVTFRDVVPDRHDVPLSSLAESFELTPRQVNPGERFRIRLSGPNRDRCNARSADLDRTAERGRMVFRDLPWQTTVRACVSPP
jgi:hypothetical protein